MSATIRWLKAVEGVGKSQVGAVARAATPMLRMWDDIGGTDDPMALYIKMKARPVYNDGEPRGCIGGLVWPRQRLPSENMFSHAEDEHYGIAVPLAKSRCVNGPSLRAAVFSTFGGNADAVWKSLRGSMTGGKPFRIDQGDYAPLGRELTRLLAAELADVAAS